MRHVATSQNEAKLTPTQRTQADGFLSSLDLVSFSWDLVSDALVWGAGAAALFQDVPAEALATAWLRLRSGFVV